MNNTLVFKFHHKASEILHFFIPVLRLNQFIVVLIFSQVYIHYSSKPDTFSIGILLDFIQNYFQFFFFFFEI